MRRVLGLKGRVLGLKGDGNRLSTSSRGGRTDPKRDTLDAHLEGCPVRVVVKWIPLSPVAHRELRRLSVKRKSGALRSSGGGGGPMRLELVEQRAMREGMRALWSKICALYTNDEVERGMAGGMLGGKRSIDRAVTTNESTVERMVMHALCLHICWLGTQRESFDIFWCSRGAQCTLGLYTPCRTSIQGAAHSEVCPRSVFLAHAPSRRESPMHHAPRICAPGFSYNAVVSASMAISTRPPKMSTSSNEIGPAAHAVNLV